MAEDQTDILVTATDPATIVRIYHEAANKMFATSDDDAGYFFLTHAYIHALEAGLPVAKELEQVLHDGGRM